MDPRQHWDEIYRRKGATGVSWYQPAAELSLALIRRLAPDPHTPVLDVGGGASTLVDGLLGAGYEDVTVLDVSGAALALAKERLGAAAARVRWIEASVLEAELPRQAFAVWHDRAVFHFLTAEPDRRAYVEQVRRAVRPGGHVIVAAFGLDGPPSCSGLPVVRYGPDSMHDEFGASFRLLDSVREDHHTPAGKVQSFVYCLCRVEADPRAASR
jgi:SAM-dependent methyltransferase